MEQQDNAYEQTAREAVELGNRIADNHSEASLSEIADGLLAGAVQYWLYAHQPCDDPHCEDCQLLCTAELRLDALRRTLEEFARASEYFHSPTDFDAGRA